MYLEPPPAPTHAYYHHDGNGNVTMLVDGAQRPVARYLYDPYGDLLAKDGILAEANVYRFNSKEWHDRSGNYHFGFHFYNPSLQRFLNTDPLGEAGGINLYQFVGNNALNSVDPWGLCGWGFNDPFGRKMPMPRFQGPTQTDLAIAATVASMFVEPLDWAMTAKEIYDEPGNPFSYAGLLPFVPSAAGKFLKRLPDGGTCLLRDPATDQVMRSGRSNDLARRAQEHARDPRFRDFEFEPVHRTDDYAEQRGLEQLLHDYYKPPLDRINPISPVNPNLQDYLDAARKFMKDSCQK